MIPTSQPRRPPAPIRYLVLGGAIVVLLCAVCSRASGPDPEPQPQAQPQPEPQQPTPANVKNPAPEQAAPALPDAGVRKPRYFPATKSGGMIIERQGDRR